MATIKDFKNLSGLLVIRDFRIAFGVPVLTSDKEQAVIPYTGFANPILTADLTVYEYSIDNGMSWDTMATSSGKTGLSFTATGASYSLVWDTKIDIGSLMFNNYIRIRLKAESGIYETSEASYVLYLEKITTSPTPLSQSDPFPPDYQGTSGAELMKKAPRSN